MPHMSHDAQVHEDRTEEALSYWRCAVDALPREPRTHANLAHHLYDAGRFAEAVSAYERALARGGDGASFHRELSEVR